MEDELRESLFGRDELLESPEIRALVFLPLDETLDSADFTMIERMLEALGISSGQRRILFHRDSPEWDKVTEEDVLILFFSSQKLPIDKPEPKTGPAGTWFKLPPPSLIRSDLGLKRLVWDLIKS